MHKVFPYNYTVEPEEMKKINLPCITKLFAERAFMKHSLEAHNTNRVLIKYLLTCIAEATGMQNWHDQPEWLETFHTINAMQRLEQHLEFQANNLKRYIMEDVSTTPDDINLRNIVNQVHRCICLLYTSPSPRDKRQSRMPSSA